jgi:DNA-binding Lrp family transcriptional regulator
MAKIDEKDKQILNLLLENPGITQKQIGEKIGLTGAAVNNRLQRFRAKGIIKGFQPIISLDKIGYGLTAIVNIRVKAGKMGAAEKKWSKSPNVCSIYRISGDYDLLIIAKFKDMKELDVWSNTLFDDAEVIARTNTSVVFGGEKEGVNPNRVE